jgi:hypothetical protein
MQVQENYLAEETRLVRQVQNMTNKHKKPYTEEREEISKLISADEDRDPELLQTFFGHDISLGELMEKRQELQDVVEHLFEFHLKSDYSKEQRIQIHNARSLENNKTLFLLKLEDVLEHRKKLKQQEVEISSYSACNQMKGDLRLARNKHLIAILNIDTELINLATLYKYLIYKTPEK